jgi:hypothetical protein
MSEAESQRRMRIEYVLKEREARSASHIAEALRHLMNLIDDQSPTVLEALTDYEKNLLKPGSGMPQHRHEIATAMVKYFEHAARKARQHEDTLYHAITGKEENT